MTTHFPVKPQYLKYVESEVSTQDRKQARPVTILDLPTGEVTRAEYDALVARIEALETPDAG